MKIIEIESAAGMRNLSLLCWVRKSPANCELLYWRQFDGGFRSDSREFPKFQP